MTTLKPRQIALWVLLGALAVIAAVAPLVFPLLPYAPLLWLAWLAVAIIVSRAIVKPDAQPAPPPS